MTFPELILELMFLGKEVTNSKDKTDETQVTQAVLTLAEQERRQLPKSQVRWEQLKNKPSKSLWDSTTETLETTEEKQDYVQALGMDVQRSSKGTWEQDRRRELLQLHVQS